MRRHLRILSVSLLAMSLALAAACGGGGDEKQTSIKPAEADLLVSNPSEALGASAGKFEDEVDSVEGEFILEMKIGDVEVGANGTFAYQAPDRVHMTMDIAGAGEELKDLGQFGQFEVLILGDDVYVKTSYTSWMSGSIDEFEDVAGSSFGDNSLDPTLLGVDFSSPVTMDILVDPGTLLPFTLEAKTKLDFGQESMDFAMKFKFFDYNGRVDIPEPPTDTKPFGQAFQGSLFGD